MKDAVVKRFQEVKQKIQIPQKLAIAIGLSLSIVIMIFKMIPHFSQRVRVVAVGSNPQVSKDGLSPAPVPKGLMAYLLNDDKQNDSNRSGPYKTYGSGPRLGAGWTTSKSNNTGNQVIERPLFDNLTVTLTVALEQAFSSAQGDGAVEARVLSLHRSGPTGSMSTDTSVAEGATLHGSAAANFEQKKVQIRFTELVMRDGKRFSIAGVAIDAETNSLGVTAHYSSGLASRLLGVGISQAITAADQIGMAHVLENTNDSSVVNRELNRMTIDANGQVVGDLGSEATKDLRDTKAELSLPAGTIFPVRLKATAPNSGAYHE